MCLSKWLNLLRTAQFKTALSAEKTSNVDFKKSLQRTMSRQRHENVFLRTVTLFRKHLGIQDSNSSLQQICHCFGRPEGRLIELKHLLSTYTEHPSSCEEILTVTTNLRLRA